MTHDELHVTKRAMKAYGGSFVNALAELLDVADGGNTATAIAAWPEVFVSYGPGSDFYEAVSKPRDDARRAG